MRILTGYIHVDYDNFEKGKSENELKQLEQREKQAEKAVRKKENLYFAVNVIILLIAAAATLLFLNSTGAYPWGSDTYGHLYKASILSDSIRSGKFFINYDENWYNGVQPYRYWAPLPYYILAAINLITGNIITTFNVFIGVVFIVGGLGWLLWGKYTKRQMLGLAIALMWFFVPNNLRILFSEGNIPYVLVNTLIPYVFLYYYKTLQGTKIRTYIALSLYMLVITLCHAMLSAMTGLTLFLMALFDYFINKRFAQNFRALLYAFSGVMLSSFWLYPALKGGIMSIDKSAAAEVMKGFTTPLSISLNPMLRFSNIEVYYFGLAFAAAALFGLLFSKQKDRAPYIVVIAILLGTTRAAVPLLQKLPMNQLFWVYRATSIAAALVIGAILLWKNLKKAVLFILVLMFMADSAASFYLLGFNRQFPLELSKTLDIASKAASQRVAILDNSSFGSFPSYYLAYNLQGRAVNQVYGWAWQGAGTSKNIVMLNTALENGYYGFMFDRALELGADTLVVKKELINDFQSLETSASAVGYNKYEETKEAIIYKYPITGQFGTKVSYEGIAIGRYAPNAVYMFPKLSSGTEDYIDSYSYEDLKNYKLVFLSGFKYRNKKKAEELILKLSENGVRVVIDSTGFEERFLGVSAEPIAVKTGFKDMYYKGEKLQLEDFPEEHSLWKTSFLTGIDNDESYEVIDHRLINYIGNKYNNNLTFLGLNMTYYAFLTKDDNVVKMLEDTFGMKAFEIPQRQTAAINVERTGNTMKITSESSDVIVPIAALDAFETQKGRYSVHNNLIYLNENELQMKITYPHIFTGSLISGLFLSFIAAVSVLLGIEKANWKKERDRRAAEQRRLPKRRGSRRISNLPVLPEA